MNLKIIIADDHAIFRKGLKQLIIEEFVNAQITEVSTAEEAIKLIRQQPFDLVISDITMPGRSGVDLLKQICEEFPLLPVLILSMHPEEQYAVRALKAGAWGYITKNAASDELVNAIRKIRSGKKYISPTIADLLADNLFLNNNQLLHQLLSDRELEVFKLIASGKNASTISEILSLSVNTISTYRSRILEKMKLHSNAELTRYALENNLI